MRASSNTNTEQLLTFQQTVIPVVAACHQACTHGPTVSFVIVKQIFDLQGY